MSLLVCSRVEARIGAVSTVFAERDGNKHPTSATWAAGVVKKRVGSNSWRVKHDDGRSVAVTTRNLRVLEAPEKPKVLRTHQVTIRRMYSQVLSFNRLWCTILGVLRLLSTRVIYSVACFEIQNCKV